jgi:Mrp family chromosome partitioning ATPase
MRPEPSIQMLEYLRAVGRRWRLVTLVVALCTGMALVVSLSSPKQYDASVQLLLRADEPINSLVNPTAASRATDPERDLNTDVALIKLGPTAGVVRQRLKLKRSTGELLNQIEVTPSSTSDIVELRVRDLNPVVAARIANTFAEEYVQFRVRSARQRYREAADLAKQQLLELSPADLLTPQGRELQARQRELEITAALQTGGAELVRRARVPSGESRPRPKLSAVIGGMLGLLLGVGVALAMNLIDRRFKDEEEAEIFFGLPILAAIPRPARRAAAFDDPAQRNAYGLLATNLRLASGGGASSAVLITSPGPGDGKTSVSFGVARAYARLGLSVVIVESDLRRPAFGRYADVSSSSGLVGALSGEPVANLLLWLDVDTLRPTGRHGDNGVIGILPAGAVPHQHGRLLTDPGADLVLKVIRSLADVVIIDSAPIGTVNDAAAIVPMVDAVALVARLNKTNKDAGRRAIRTLRNLDADVVGLVVTDAGVGKRHVYYQDNPPKPAVTAVPGQGSGTG